MTYYRSFMFKFNWLILLAFISACSQKPDSKSVLQVKEYASVIGDGNFGSFGYNQSQIKSFYIKNNSLESVNYQPQITGVDANDFEIIYQTNCSDTQPQNNCLVKVNFTSYGKVAKVYSATLKLGESELALSAEIMPTTSPMLEAQINGQVGLELNYNLTGKNSLGSYVVFKNIGTSPIPASNISFSNGSAPLFEVFNTCNNATLKPGQICLVKIFAKANNTNETKVGSLSFNNHAVVINYNSTEVIGQGSIDAKESIMNVGDFYQAGQVSLEVLKFTNNGTGRTTLEIPPLPAGYAVAVNNCLNVAPKSTCSVRLSYTHSGEEKGVFSSPVTLGNSIVNLEHNVISDPKNLGSIASTISSHVVRNTCQALEVSLKETNGSSFIAATENVIAASGANLYSDASCSNLISEVKIAPYQAAIQVYTKNAVDETRTLTLTHKNLVLNKSVRYYDFLETAPEVINLVVGTSKTLNFTGGVAPYVYEKISGVGAVMNNFFVGGPTAGVAQVRVTDALNQVALINFNVVTVLTANVLSFDKIVNQTQSVTGIGGLAPYTYSKVSGVGIIDSAGLFSAGAVAGSVQIKVMDALNQEVLVSGDVYSVLTVSPAAKTITLANMQLISPVGGKSPYSFAMASGTGSVSGSGIYTPVSIGSGTVRVTDALGQQASAVITVNANLAINSGNCSFANIPESVECTVATTGGVGPMTFSTDKGTIGQSTGLFKGLCENNVGLSQVTAMDSLGNSATIPVSYSCVYQSCLEIRAKGYSSITLDAWIDPDGLSTAYSPVKVQCFFPATTERTAQDVYTLVARLNPNDASIRHWNDLVFWQGSGVGTLSGTSDYMSPIFANISSFKSIRLEYNYNGSSKAVSTYEKSDNTLSFKQNLLLPTSPGNNPGWNREYVNGTDAQSFFSGTMRFNISTEGNDYHRIFYGSVANSVCNQGGSLGGEGDGFGWRYEIARQTTDTRCQLNFNRLVMGSNFQLGTTTLGNQSSAPVIAPNTFYTSGLMNVYIKDTYYYYPTSCLDAKNKGALNSNGNTGSGTYTIDPDGYAYGQDAYTVECEQSIHGGGWTKVYQTNTSALYNTGGWNTSAVVDASAANGYLKQKVLSSSQLLFKGAETYNQDSRDLMSSSPLYYVFNSCSNLGTGKSMSEILSSSAFIGGTIWSSKCELDLTKMPELFAGYVTIPRTNNTYGKSLYLHTYGSGGVCVYGASRISLFPRAEDRGGCSGGLCGYEIGTGGGPYTQAASGNCNGGGTVEYYPSTKVIELFVK